jgi:8-oxo-dGTP pyrophosphatase MutT (NUDIX family)
MKRDYLDKLKRRLNEILPGSKVQYAMAPAARQPIPFERMKDYQPRASGVLILIYPNKGILSIILMKRPGYNGAHSGQISLPGGKTESSDKNIIDTALREGKEEVGIDISKLEIIGQLTDLYVPPSNFCISPVIAWAWKRPEFIADPKEVAALIEVPLDLLRDNKIVRSKTMTLFDGFEAETPYFDINGHIVWGATAMILNEFIFILNEIDKQ